MICEKYLIPLLKANKPSCLWRKANQIKVDWRRFMRGINELCVSLKDY